MDDTNNNLNRGQFFKSNQSGLPASTLTQFSGLQVSEDVEMEVPCICNRPIGHVICLKCGAEFDGRVFTQCQVHPNKIPLMDHQECSNRACRSQTLSELPTQR